MKIGLRKLCDIGTHEWALRHNVATRLMTAGIDYEIYWHGEHVRFAVDARNLRSARVQVFTLRGGFCVRAGGAS